MSTQTIRKAAILGSLLLVAGVGATYVGSLIWGTTGAVVALIGEGQFVSLVFGKHISEYVAR